jgi:molybdopterin/thiamine biosynthesis adenylyltransferase
VDYGVVEQPNLSRGTFDGRHLGMTKVEAMCRVLAERAPHTQAIGVHGDVRVNVPEFIYSEHDLVVVTLDSWSARMHANLWTHALPGRTRVVISAGLVGRSWDVIVAMPKIDGGCMQCPHDPSIALSDEAGGCSALGSPTEPIDPSVSFAGMAAAAQIVDVAFDVLGCEDERLAGQMISYDHDARRLDLLVIARNPSCRGHRRLNRDESIAVPIANHDVADLEQLVAVALNVDAEDVAVCADRELVFRRTCARCSYDDSEVISLLRLRREWKGCPVCSAPEVTLHTGSVLPRGRRLSDLGLPPGKTLTAIVNGQRFHLVPEERRSDET